MSAATATSAAASRDNNFDALRVFAALMVVYGHGWILCTDNAPGLWGVPFGRIGLDIFFSISGYMVTGSWLRTPSLRPFLAKRALRIFPGLIACVLFTACIMGAGVTRLPLGQYLSDPGTLRYFSNIVLHSTLYLPGVFDGMKLGGPVNGSLWSLFPEVLCYLTVPLFGLAALRLRMAALAVGGVLAGSLGLWLFYGYAGEAFVFNGADVKYMLVQVPFFFFGALYRLLDGRLDSFFRTDFAMLGFTLNWMVSSWYGWWNIPVEWLTLPYVVLCFGCLSMPVLRRAGRFGDFSYGLYLYAFPVQQVIVATMPRNEHPILTCMLLTLPLAALSWHLVEAPALRWKVKAGGAMTQAALHDPTVFSKP